MSKVEDLAKKNTLDQCSRYKGEKSRPQAVSLLYRFSEGSARARKTRGRQFTRVRLAAQRVAFFVFPRVSLDGLIIKKTACSLWKTFHIYEITTQSAVTNSNVLSTAW